MDDSKLIDKLNRLDYEQIRELAFLKLKEREQNRLRQLRKKERDSQRKGVCKNANDGDI